MELDIISAWERVYGKRMLGEVILEIKTRKENRVSNRKNDTGKNGLAQRHEHNMMHVLQISKFAWDDINEMTLARCWLKSDILPVGTASVIRSVYGQIKTWFNDNGKKQVIRVLQQFQLVLYEEDLLRDEMTDQFMEETMEKGMDVENEATIQEAIVLGSVDEIERILVHMGLNDEDDKDSDVEFAPTELPSLHKIY